MKLVLLQNNWFEGVRAIPTRRFARCAVIPDRPRRPIDMELLV
jgi:hypothetical protein